MGYYVFPFKNQRPLGEIPRVEVHEYVQEEENVDKLPERSVPIDIHTDFEASVHGDVNEFKQSEHENEEIITDFESVVGNYHKQLTSELFQ